MKRAAGILMVAAAALAQDGAGTQPDRAAYQAAFREWRMADPNLERDSATAGATLGARADPVAAEAAKYFAARRAYLDGLALDAELKAAALDAVPVPPAFAGNPSGYAASQRAAIGASIDAIANDPDRAIQRLRQSLERERTALLALSSALADSQNGRELTERTSANAEQARDKVAQHYHSLAAGLQQTALATAQEGTRYADYYRALSEGARAAAEAPVIASAAPRITVDPAPAVISSPAQAVVNNPAPAARTRSVTALPLSRYVGSWIYPTVGAQYHGSEPESVDMAVRENSGQAKGTLSVRFRLAANRSADAVVRFEFEGAFQSTRNQSFPLVTASGAKGMVELIPGSAFNLLEVSFTVEERPGDKPGVIHQGNFLLIKK
jgi:hypothetical protein